LADCGLFPVHIQTRKTCGKPLLAKYGIKKHVTQFKSKNQKGKLILSLKRQIKQIQNEVIYFEERVEMLIKENEPELLTNLTSISGIGKKTALLLISSTNAFKTFENHKQLSAYFGLAPAERTSGTSVKGRSRITKKGNPLIRNHLFLCSFTACEHNPQCKALYKRIVDKGKSKKLALIAVCNKLLKQVFAVAQSGIPYDPYYKSSLAS
jgi:transposase